MCLGKSSSAIFLLLLTFQSVAGILAGLLSQFALPVIGFNYLFLLTGFFMLASFLMTTVLHCTDMAPLEQYSALSEEDEE